MVDKVVMMLANDVILPGEMADEEELEEEAREACWQMYEEHLIHEAEKETQIIAYERKVR